jgi:hypothetical protein
MIGIVIVFLQRSPTDFVAFFVAFSANFHRLSVGWQGDQGPGLLDGFFSNHKSRFV